MESLTRTLYALAQQITSAQEDPDELFEQVRPLLVKMGLANMSDRTKTKLIPGQVKGKNSLYCILLRRNAVINADVIDHIKRNEDFLDSIVWNAKAIEVYVWYPYAPPATQEAAPAAPRPGVPPAATPLTPR
jgi:hypothetical protein